MGKISRGKLNTPVNILRKTTSRSPSGAVKETETVVGTAWCQLLPVSTSDFVQANAAGTSIDAKIHFDLSVVINTSDRLQTLDISNTTYDVLSIMPVPEDNKKIVLCRTKVK
ncbi:phage head closure protein [Psychrobacter sp. NPDC078370]|uniref:phage head closure protein n=1 Tax=unclassified Psychrobacter TaxID=196806 RepID=UPI003D0824ED